MNNQLAIATTNNTTTTGVVKRRKPMHYLKHVFIGAIIAVCTFTATLAAQPSIAEEPEYPGIVYITSDASREDVEYIFANVNIDTDIVAEIELEDNEVPLSAGEFLVSYIERDNSIAEAVVDYFINNR